MNTQMLDDRGGRASAWAVMTSGAQAASSGKCAVEPGSAAAARCGLKRVAYRLCWTEGGARQCPGSTMREFTATEALAQPI